MSNPAKYPLVSRSLHWLILFAVVASYVTIFTGLYPWHFFFGALTLVLAVVRLVTMHVFAKAVPAIVPPINSLQKLVAKIVKILLALIFVLIPLTGILFRLYFGRNFMIFEWEIIPAGFITPNPEIGSFLRTWHVNLGWVGIGLIGLHSAAALFHHYVVKDNTLKRIL
ncbi:hypothetical protein CJP74_07580 [Psittacicella melopsittaci]|uniref:Cytochrome b561 bacterial/Ni-hydrogenase domain-containing protein n=1 Tax=Psittacicella melopsittaci TaxID=2028576 RepID=A0A3A1Y1R8_9GAMM|nr:cytochrome b [Psittacicella melopsittaci]RIY31360.1 hypothetical protein CJP74_07580 [Psittacicella melopsittaci]